MSNFSSAGWGGKPPQQPSQAADDTSTPQQQYPQPAPQSGISGSLPPPPFPPLYPPQPTWPPTHQPPPPIPPPSLGGGYPPPLPYYGGPPPPIPPPGFQGFSQPPPMPPWSAPTERPSYYQNQGYRAPSYSGPPPSHQSSYTQRTKPYSVGSSSIDEGDVESADETPEISEDQQWINDWLKERVKDQNAKSTKSRADSLTIPEARARFKEVMVHTERLRSLLALLKDNQESGVKSDPETVDEIRTISVKLKELRTSLNPDVINTLNEKLQKTRKKRERLVKRKQKIKAEAEERKERREANEKKIDQWQKAIHDKQDAIKKERELKKAADETLGEVRRKIADAKKCTELLKALSKLRQIRKESAEQRGLNTTREIDATFHERYTRLQDIIARQSEVYAAEAKTLEVMMETENLQDENREKGRIQQKEKDQLKKWEKQIRQNLFGAEEPVGPEHPLFSFQQYYYAPQHHLDAFLQVRSNWDTFLVPEDTPGGSSIPPRWVEPGEPASEAWEAVLKQKDK